jgi:hypothetical protein
MTEACHISFMGLASYLIFVDIYSAAVYVCEDTKLHQSIRKIAIKESKLLDSIGSVHIEQRVIVSTKAAQKKTSLTEGDMKQYSEITLKEIKSKNEDSNNIQRRKKYCLFLVQFDWGVTTL